MKKKTRILLMDGDMPDKSLDLADFLPNIQEGQIMRVFGKKTKIIDISHTIFERDNVMQVVQVVAIENP